MEKKKGWVSEFREFISRGNVMDLAVGVIIGTAFQSIIKSLVDDLVMPLLNLIIGKTDFTQWTFTIGSGDHAAVLTYGNFIAAVINFFLMALVIFFLVKFMNKISSRVKKQEEAAAPTIKKCPYCCSDIPIEATRCPFCTSEVGQG